MKVRFENHGDLTVADLGRGVFSVPRGAGKKATVLKFRDEEEAKTIISILTGLNGALSYTLVDESEDGGGNSALVFNNDKNSENENIGGGGDNQGDNKMTIEDFKLKVKAVTKGKAGWWTVEIDGLGELVKVRNAETEDDAIKLAFEDYVEDIA